MFFSQMIFTMRKIFFGNFSNLGFHIAVKIIECIAIGLHHGSVHGPKNTKENHLTSHNKTLTIATQTR